MLKHMCLYNNKLFKTKFEFNEQLLLSYQYNNSAKSHDNKFEKCMKLKIPLETSLKQLSLNTVKNFVSGIKCILILVFESDCLCNGFIYCETLRKRLTSIPFPEAFRKNVSYSNIFISDGPVFLCTLHNALHVYYLNTGNYNILNIEHSGFSENGGKILLFKCFDSYIKIPFIDERIFVIVSVFTATEQHLNMSMITSNSTTLHRLPLHFFFPKHYQSALKAIDVSKCIPYYTSKSKIVSDVEFIETSCVLCTSTECFVFHNGTIMHCCRLTVPLLELVSMTMKHIPISEKRYNIFLSLENQTTYLITAEDYNCKVTKVWTNIEGTIFGDLLKKGTKQILLVKNLESELWQSSSIMVDATTFLPADLLVQNSMPDDCLRTTINGLSKKIQAGKLSIVEMENRIAEKAAAIVDGMLRLNEMKFNDESYHSSKSFRESLFELFLAEDENKKDVLSKSEVKLLEEKQRFFNESWILYFHFINETERNICNPNIKILLHGKQLQTAQRIFIHGAENRCTEPKSCSDIDPKTKFSIVMKTTFPANANDSMSFILSWASGSAAEFENEIFLSKEEKVLKLRQLSFEKSQNDWNFLNYQIEKGISSPEDLYFLKCLQHKTILIILTLHSDAAQLYNLIVDSGANLLKLENSVVFNDVSFQLFGVSICFKDLGDGVTTVETFTRNENEFLLLVQFLYQNLPDDVLIQPSLFSKAEFLLLKKYVISAMKAEIDLLNFSLTAHNIPDELRKDYNKLVSDQNIGNITVPKEMYNSLRKIVSKKELYTDLILKDFTNL